jgi:hypothetical protein
MPPRKQPTIPDALLDQLLAGTDAKAVLNDGELFNALQADLDEWVAHYNQARPHQGRWCFGKTPMQTFLDSAPLAREKQNPGKAA